MGRSYWFQCSKCGYGAKVSGRADRGLNCFVQTIVCHDCKELYDAVYRLKVPDDRPLIPNGLHNNPLNRITHAGQKLSRKRLAPNFQAVIGRLLYTGVQRIKWLEFKLLCPVSEIHKVEAWTDPGKCPKCGIFLEKNVIPYRIWD